MAKITKEKALERLTLNDCSFALEWNYPRAEIKNIAIEEKGKFRAEERIQVEKKELSGAIELGVALAICWIGYRSLKNFSITTRWLPLDNRAFVRND